MVIPYKEADDKSHHHHLPLYGIFGSGLDKGDEKHIAVAKRSLGFLFVSLMFLMMIIIPTSTASLAYATTTTTKGTSSSSSSSGSRDYGISLGSDVGGNSTAGLLNSTQSGNNTGGISLGSDVGGDNNSCRREPRERGGELGALAGELGLSSQFCGQ